MIPAQRQSQLSCEWQFWTLVQGKGTQTDHRKSEPKRTCRQKLEFREAQMAKLYRTEHLKARAMWKQNSTNPISIEVLDGDCFGQNFMRQGKQLLKT